MTIHWTCSSKTDPKRSSLYTNGAESPVLRVTLYRLHSPAGCNYQLLCVFDCQSTDFANKTGESEYSQEMVDRSFWESKKFPGHILEHSLFQLCKLWDICKISCSHKYRGWGSCGHEFMIRSNFKLRKQKWTNYWNHFLYSSERQKDTTKMFRLKPVFLYLSKGRFLQNLASNSLCDVLLCFSFVWGTKREGESCHRFRQHWTEESHLQTVVQLRELATAFLYLGSTIFLGKKKHTRFLEKVNHC